MAGLPGDIAQRQGRNEQREHQAEAEFHREHAPARQWQALEKELRLLAKLRGDEQLPEHQAGKRQKHGEQQPHGFEAAAARAPDDAVTRDKDQPAERQQEEEAQRESVLPQLLGEQGASHRATTREPTHAMKASSSESASTLAPGGRARACQCSSAARENPHMRAVEGLILPALKPGRRSEVRAVGDAHAAHGSAQAFERAFVAHAALVDDAHAIRATLDFIDEMRREKGRAPMLPGLRDDELHELAAASGSRPAVGSSRISTAGRGARARARASLARMPPESWDNAAVAGTSRTPSKR